jgi:uncharacterized protein (TIGR03435 family)
MPLLLVLAATAADGAPQSFEVASIKAAAIPVGGEGGNRSRIEHTPTSLTMLNVDLQNCVQWAYGVAFFQVSGVKTSSDSYDILAKSAAPVPLTELKVMLQDLLARRFKLELHRDTKMLPVYELVVSKGGPKLPTANASAPTHTAESLPRIRSDSFVFADASMAEFGQMLSQLRGIDLPVVDHTGISGTFDITMKGAPAAAREADSAALFAILEEQLGLKLVSAKAPFEVVVIDHAQKPAEN